MHICGPALTVPWIVVGQRDCPDARSADFDSATGFGVDFAAPEGPVSDAVAAAGEEVSLPNTATATESSGLPAAPLLERILDSLVDGIIAVDGSGTVISANRRTAELIDVPPGGLRPGVRFFDVLLARDRVAVRAAIFTPEASSS